MVVELLQVHVPSDYSVPRPQSKTQLVLVEFGTYPAAHTHVPSEFKVVVVGLLQTHVYPSGYNVPKPQSFYIVTHELDVGSYF